MTPLTPSALRRRFMLDPGVAYLNHGSFGACSRAAFSAYQAYQRELERQPSEFLLRRLEAMLGHCRQELGHFLGSPAENLVLCANATTAVNIVCRSLTLQPGDEVVATDHEYGACKYAWQWSCQRAGARYRWVALPHPLVDPGEAVSRIIDAFCERTRAVFLSHITSTAGAVLPIEPVVAAARQRGIITVVDGAHAPGQLDLDLEALGADIYTGNLHKWLCAPKGCAFLYVHPEHQWWIGSNIISWGYADCSNLLDHHDCSFIRRNGWQGTLDPAAYLAVPATLRFFREYLLPARERSRELTRDAARQLLEKVGLRPLVVRTENWCRQMVACQLPAWCEPEWLHDELYRLARVEVWTGWFRECPVIRLSIAAYTSKQDVDRAVTALQALLMEPHRS